MNRLCVEKEAVEVGDGTKSTDRLRGMSRIYYPTRIKAKPADVNMSPVGLAKQHWDVRGF